MTAETKKTISTAFGYTELRFRVSVSGSGITAGLRLVSRPQPTFVPGKIKAGMGGVPAFHWEVLLVQALLS